MEGKKIIYSQDLCVSFPDTRIVKAEVQKKEDGNWIVVAVIENDRAVTLARYPTKDEALAAEMRMWLCDEPSYYFPIIGGDV